MRSDLITIVFVVTQITGKVALITQCGPAKIISMLVIETTENHKIQIITELFHSVKT